MDDVHVQPVMITFQFRDSTNLVDGVRENSLSDYFALRQCSASTMMAEGEGFEGDNLPEVGKALAA
jgi:hypothetical protein